MRKVDEVKKREENKEVRNEKKVMTIGMWEILKLERLIIGNSTAMIMKAYRNVWFPGKNTSY